LNQEYHGPLEFIIVAESSRDEGLLWAQDVVSKSKSKVVVKFCSDFEPRGANPRNSKMAHGYDFATHSWLYWHAIDSHIVSNYFASLVAMAQNNPDFYVTTFPVNVRPRSFGALVETVALNLEVTKFFLFSTATKEGAVAYGGSLFFSRSLLERSGGLEPTLNRFTEDVILAQSFKRVGGKCLLSPYLTYVPQEHLSFLSFWNRQIRWLMIAKYYMPGAFFLGPLFSFPQIFFVWGLWFQNWTVFEVGLSFFILRMIQALIFEKLLGAPQKDWWCVLFLPVYDFLFPILWVGALITRRVNWAGAIMISDSNGIVRKG